MTKTGLTEIVCVIDKSGSMGHLQQSVISGFNDFIHKQKNLPGAARVSLIQFSDEVDWNFESRHIQEVQPLSIFNYRPGGSTALLDAVGGTIDAVGSKLAGLPESDRPEKVIFVIQTDGAENCSRTYTYADVRAKISHQQEKYSWEFIFLGANIDAKEVGSLIGIAASNIAQFNATLRGVANSYGIVASAVGNYRTTGSTLAEGQSSIGDGLTEDELPNVSW